jgi:hypothetical protein
MESELLKEIEKLGFTADGSASPAGRTIYGAKDYANGRVSIYINTTSANHRDDSVIEVEVYFIPLYFVKRFFGLKKDKGLDMTKMKSLLPGKQQSQIIDLGTGLFDRSPEDNIKDIIKLIKDADKEYNKEYQNYQPEVNEARVDIKLSTSEELEGTVARFRLGSEVVNLASVADRNNDMSVRDARVFSDTEIGFESAADRKAAIRFIERAFKSGELSVDDYAVE